MLPSKTQQKKIPYQNAPSVTLGRLAIDKSVQGAGLGRDVGCPCDASGVGSV